MPSAAGALQGAAGQGPAEPGRRQKYQRQRGLQLPERGGWACARDYIDRGINGSLSGGELKRIEIAMVLARGSKLSIFDEPEAGIDLWSFQNLIRVFEKRRQTRGSILIISHQERILNIADRSSSSRQPDQKRGPAQQVLPPCWAVPFQQPGLQCAGRQSGRGAQMIDAIEQNLLREVADLDSLPVGAYNIRANGQLAGRNTTANIDIVTKDDKPGIDIYIRPFTKNESVHIPVILSQTGLTDLVYNDFHIGEGADVTIIAGCGIHNCGGGNAQHDGIHTFYLAKNAKLRYVEKHYGEGDGRGKQVMNPTTIVHLAEGAQMEMETTQIAGIDDTMRKTSGDLAEGASLVIHEKIMTTGDQHAVTDFDVDLNGEGCSANVVSRSVAKDVSKQEFISHINGNCACAGHSECDAIIMDHASVIASPALTANSVDASLIHEAAIGKIAGEQLIKLMTLGLTEKEAEDQIVNGFLK